MSLHQPAPPISRKSGNRFHLLAALAFLLAALPSFGSLLLNPSRVLGVADSDLRAQYLYWREFGFGQIASGHFPLWNPYAWSGTPFFGDPQSALLYPPNGLHLLMPATLALSWIAYLHFAFAGWMTALWCRRRGVSDIGAILAGMVYALSGPIVTNLRPGHVPVICSAAWAPVLFMVVDEFLIAPNWRAAMKWWLLGSIAVAMLLLDGYPQYAYFSGLAVGIYFLLNSIRERRRVRVGALLLTTFGLGLGIASVQVMTSAYTAGQSVRSGGLPYDVAASFSLSIKDMLTLIWAGAFGNDVSRPYSGESLLWESNVYVGAAALLLAGIGLLAAEPRARRFASVMVLLMFWLALGAHTSLHHVLYRYLPGFSFFRASNRFAGIGILFLAMLSAMGWDAGAVWLRRVAKPGLYHGVGTLAAVLVVAPLLSNAWTLRASSDAPHPSADAIETLTGNRAPGSRVVSETLAEGGAQYGFLNVGGFNPLVSKRYAQFIATTDGVDPANIGLDFEISKSSQAFKLLRADRVMLTSGGSQRLPMEKALPRLLLVGRCEVTTPEKALAEATSDTFDGRDRVILESSPFIEPVSSEHPGEVSILSETSDSIEIIASLTVPQILLITDAFDPAWRVESIMAPQDRYTVMPADYVLRAIPLNAGKHHFRLIYRPPGFIAGAWISAISAVVWLIAAMVTLFPSMLSKRRLA